MYKPADRRLNDALLPMKSVTHFGAATESAYGQGLRHFVHVFCSPVRPQFHSYGICILNSTLYSAFSSVPEEVVLT